MPTSTILPNHFDTVWRKDCDREWETLRTLVNLKLQRAKLEGIEVTHTARQEPTEYNSGIPRAISSILQPNASQSQLGGGSHGGSRAPSYAMLTSASVYGLRGSGRSGSLIKSSSSSVLLKDELPELARNTSFGALAKGQTSWQPVDKSSMQRLPPTDLLDARWPSILRSAIDSKPLRPELKKAGAMLQDDGYRWISGSWRPRAANSPRMTPM